MTRLGIVGLGLMGSSLALAVRAAEPGATVVGVDTDASVVRLASESGAFDEVDVRLERVSGSPLIVVATPIRAIPSVFARLRGTAAVVTDVASVKSQVMAWAAQAGLDVVGGHPMCGRELSGIGAARADLFQGAPWVLTHEEPSVLQLVRLVGARPMVMPPEEHDRLVAGVSHAAFLLSVAYMLAISRSPQWTPMRRLAAGGFTDMTRLAAGDPAMYEQISAANATNIAAWLDRIDESLSELRDLLSGDRTALGRLFEEARAARQAWAAARR